MYEQTPLLMVEDDETLRRLADRLARARVIGVDTESDSMYHYQEKVCLLQFTDAEGDIIVDPLGIEDMSPLAPIFENPRILKVFHGADYDLVCLKRDFGYQTRNLFDTLVAAQFIGLERLGLADLIDLFFGIPLEKAYQRHDWSQRPLEPEHLDYARGDTHFLPALREILTRRLRAVGRLEHQQEECRLLEQKEWQGRSFDPDGYLRIKGARQLDPTALRVLRRLWLYRNEQARALDRPAFKVLGDSLLLEVAIRQPTDRAALDRLFPNKRAMKRRHTQGMLEAVRAGRADEDVPLPQPAENHEDDTDNRLPIVRLRGRAADRVQEALKAWRNDLCARSPLHTPFTVASNADLRAIARVRPLNLEELASIPGIRRWQVRDHGRAILEVLDRVAPESELDPDPKPTTGKRRRRRRGGRGSSPPASES